MKNVLQFDFTVDKQANEILVVREFAADLSLVWRAWTDAEILDQWWAPRPWKTVTKQMDFRVGGMWLYAMVGPDGSEHWCRADYQSIETEKSFKGLDAFCDAEGNVNPQFPRSTWHNTFARHPEDATLVTIRIAYDKLEDLEKVIAMGFKEGFTMGLQNLDEWLATNR